MISNKHISLLVSGSIAAYKTPELVRELQRHGASVQCALSESACNFVSPLTLQILSQKAVYTDMFDPASEREIGHISLADKADLVICAPASADILAKAAGGLADDLLSTVILASRSPVLFVPAMNVNMWQNRVTQENVTRLRDRGHLVLEPDEGFLACGWTGPGRFPEIERIIIGIEFALSPKELKGTRVIITAGPTRESIDPVRYISNRSSGKMGYAMARVAYCMGADVTLVSGPTALAVPPGIKTINVETAEEMRKAVFESVMAKVETSVALQAVYMAAAVSDHRPSVVSREKLKMDKSQSYDLNFVPANDILFELGSRREEIEKSSGTRLALVGFAAETGDVESMIHHARLKREAKNLDLVVANLAHESFGRDSARVWLISKNGREEEIALADKHRISEKIIRASLKS
ncbi:MAG TPA: bifunctional phosphopantothenoylcysteine decarboxylase/phosphopantothenate--cysteine ligase CoaBC [Oligoflexia bacterium]|nr:bifunctional phosphopantothenoylcysteine decarboxylase/phosphopantothenate--cysteine ligase CoaBC [Oligoflexia bacterium]HMP49834.1 bifunctional phosphopantothenoylcysteine decarboxylase/phosphopantothenate--cysteine ligase CoaBC [Oligoflexia bacterium]